MVTSTFFKQFDAVLFDMDGTILNSEPLVEMAVHDYLSAAELNVDIDYRQFDGITWEAVANALKKITPQISHPSSLGRQLQQRFHRLLRLSELQEVPGAIQIVKAASDVGPTALVTSGDTKSANHIVDYFGLRPYLDHLICAEDISHSKPHPEGYLLAASKLMVDPCRCLVFEDSAAGVNAAIKADMTVVAIGHPENSALAFARLDDFTQIQRLHSAS